MRNQLALLGITISAALIASLQLLSPPLQVTSSQSATLDVVINEVAWGGTAADASHEWIELYNNTNRAFELDGWTLASSDGSPTISLTGEIPASGYYLLERVSDCAVSDIHADQPAYSGALANVGERLELRDAAGRLIDSADGDGGWPGGSGAPDYSSMERVDPTSLDGRTNWASNDGLVRNGLDCNGAPLNGTPKARNSATPWTGADLRVAKNGPLTIGLGERITYTIALSNEGLAPAGSVRLTDVLPLQVRFLTHTAPFALAQPLTGTLVWDLGVVPTTVTEPLTFTLTGWVSDAGLELTNVITVATTDPEVNLANNHDSAVTLLGAEPVTSVVLIEALYYDTYEPGQTDEAFRLINVSPASVEIGGWEVTDQEEAAFFPEGMTLAPGQSIWGTRKATAFERQFGFKPDFETSDSDPAVPEMSGSWPRLADTGDEFLLLDGEDRPVDALVYEGGDVAVVGWEGPAVVPWAPSPIFAAKGQILYRKRDQASGTPVSDTDTASDWAQDPDDSIDGRKVLYPGWDLDSSFFTQRITETATLTVAVGPDHLFQAVASLLAGAKQSIQIETYTLRSKELAAILEERLDAGVTVSLLLEGAPAVEGVTDQEKWITNRLHSKGAGVLFMINDADSHVFDRYRGLHAKAIVIDGEAVLVGSENLSYRSMPADDKANGTAGRRGVYLITDAPGVVEYVQAIFGFDADPVHHADTVGCDRMPELCTPPLGFSPESTPDWMTYTVQFTDTQTWQGTFAFEVIQAPANSLRTQDGLLGLLSRAGAGDTVLVEQLYERVHWGSDLGTPDADPNPRLEAYLDAARRGAKVRVLLDRYLDEDGQNAETAAYLRAVAQSEGLDLQVRLADPTYLSLHNKMILADIDGRGYVHVGSINGSEASSKINRELALQVQSGDAYQYLRGVFEYDWRTATPSVYLPLAVKRNRAPQPADHLLVSEVYYATIPEKEWVEIFNPTGQAIDIAGYKMGDAVHPGDYEGMYRFPAGTVLPGHGLLVVAVTATGFQEVFPGVLPDLEIFETDPMVPNLLRHAAWGTGDWGLSNAGDEVLLLDGVDVLVDAVVYGGGSHPGVIAHPGVTAYSHSLQRHPEWQDTDDCMVDFRDWPFPSPGSIP